MARVTGLHLRFSPCRVCVRGRGSWRRHSVRRRPGLRAFKPGREGGGGVVPCLLCEEIMVLTSSSPLAKTAVTSNFLGSLSQADHLSVMRHPAQQQNVGVVEWLITVLRRCRTFEDYDNVQRALFQHLHHSRNIARSAVGARLASPAADPSRRPYLSSLPARTRTTRIHGASKTLSSTACAGNSAPSATPSLGASRSTTAGTSSRSAATIRPAR